MQILTIVKNERGYSLSQKATRILEGANQEQIQSILPKLKEKGYQISGIPTGVGKISEA